jgi:hypothetical protein
MNDLERWLKEQPLAKPDPECDRRIERLFLEVPERPPQFWKRPVALWQCLAACVLCVMMGFLVTRTFFPTEAMPTHITENFYVVPGSNGTVQGVFDLTQRPKAPSWKEFRQVEVETLDTAEDKGKI